MCPKNKFYGLFSVMLLVKHTALEHNFGYSGANMIVYLLGHDSKLRNSLQWMGKEKPWHAEHKTRKKMTEKKDNEY